MANPVLRNISIRGLLLSLFFLLCGIVILFFGVRESVIYNSEPVSPEELQYSFADYTRVRLKNYRPVGIIDIPGYSYFIVEYTEGRYCLVETVKDKYIYNNINVQDRTSVKEQSYTIDGYLYHLKDYQTEGIRKGLEENKIEPEQIDTIGKYAVKIVVKDYSMIIFGSLLILLSITAFVLSRWLFRHNTGD